MDRLTRAQRSERMSRIAGKDTKLEIAVRRLLSSRGYRYRLHSKGLPGRPDIVFVARKRVVFVHGCMWHQHGCGRYKQPKSNMEFWDAKLAGNVTRDRRNQRELHRLGWKYRIVWECQLRRPTAVLKSLVAFLGPVSVNQTPAKAPRSRRRN